MFELQISPFAAIAACHFCIKSDYANKHIRSHTIRTQHRDNEMWIFIAGFVCVVYHFVLRNATKFTNVCEFVRNLYFIMTCIARKNLFAKVVIENAFFRMRFYIYEQAETKWIIDENSICSNFNASSFVLLL